MGEHRYMVGQPAGQIFEKKGLPGGSAGFLKDLASRLASQPCIWIHPSILGVSYWYWMYFPYYMEHFPYYGEVFSLSWGVFSLLCSWLVNQPALFTSLLHTRRCGWRKPNCRFAPCAIPATLPTLPHSKTIPQGRLMGGGPPLKGKIGE